MSEGGGLSVRFGLIGTGYWATTVHAAGLAAHPGVQFLGVWGRDYGAAERLAAQYGITPEREVDALLSKVDAVAVAVPPNVQAEFACRAAEAGCHLLLEKPLALSVEAADRVVAAAAAAGVRSVVFFTLRFRPGAAEWFREVIAPAPWEGASVTIWAATLFTPGSPFHDSPWRHEHGALWDVAPHAIAALNAGLGPVVGVVAQSGFNDTVQLVSNHDGGAISNITVSLTVPVACCSPTEPPSYERVEFWGPRGLVRLPEDTAGVPPVRGFERAISALLTAVRTGTPHECDAEFGAEVVRVIAAAERFLGRPETGRCEQP
jgi:predicted dehydrogenase